MFNHYVIFDLQLFHVAGQFAFLSLNLIHLDFYINLS